MDGLAERIEHLRRKKGWSKTELANRAALHQQHVYKMLSGKRRHIEAKTIVALCKAFGVSADYLLGLKEECGAEDA